MGDFSRLPHHFVFVFLHCLPLLLYCASDDREVLLHTVWPALVWGNLVMVGKGILNCHESSAYSVVGLLACRFCSQVSLRLSVHGCCVPSHNLGVIIVGLQKQIAGSGSVHSPLLLDYNVVHVQSFV